jgi:hypothetical protein
MVYPQSPSMERGYGKDIGLAKDGRRKDGGCLPEAGMQEMPNSIHQSLLYSLNRVFQYF